MTDIISEIDEEQHQEKIANFIVTHLLKIIFGFVVVLIAVFIYSWNKNKLEKKYQNIELNYSKALSKDLKELSNIKLLDDIINSNTENGYYQLALLEKAAILSKENKFETAEEAYSQLSASSSVENSIKYLAELLSISVLMKSNKIDSVNFKFDSIKDKKNPFYISTMLKKLELLSAEKKYSEAYEVVKNISLDSVLYTNINKKVQKLTKVFKNKSNQ